MTTLGEIQEYRSRTLPPIAWLPIALLSGAVAAVLLAVSGRYGFFGDELYFVIAGRNLSWGYADQPPLVPLIALVMDTIAPGSLVALRIPPILATIGGVLVTALIAREFGGDRRAQTFSGASYAISTVGLGHTLTTTAFDILLWTVLSWLVVRWVRVRLEPNADRLLLWAGVVTAISVQVKFQIVVFCLMLVVTSLVVGPRDLVRRPLLWAAAGIVFVTTLPTLIWQAMNGWPQLAMREAVAAETAFMGSLLNAALMFIGMGVITGVVLGGYGFWRLARAEEMRPYRFFCWTALAVVVVFLLLGGRAYYVFGAFPVLWSAGAVGFQRRREARDHASRWGWFAWPAFVLTAVMSVVNLPWQPQDSLAGGDSPNFEKFMALGQIGWPQTADTVADVYGSLPPAQQQSTAVITGDYWSASAIEYFGRDGQQANVPPVYSGSRGYWFFGQPEERMNTVIFVGEVPEVMRQNFGEIRQVSKLDNGLGIQTMTQGAPVFILTDPSASWDQMWPQMHKMNAVE